LARIRHETFSKFSLNPAHEARPNLQQCSPKCIVFLSWIELIKSVFWFWKKFKLFQNLEIRFLVESAKILGFVSEIDNPALSTKSDLSQIVCSEELYLKSFFFKHPAILDNRYDGANSRISLKLFQVNLWISSVFHYFVILRRLCLNWTAPCEN